MLVMYYQERGRRSFAIQPSTHTETFTVRMKVRMTACTTALATQIKAQNGRAHQGMT